jgi:hypothetical protein
MKKLLNQNIKIDFLWFYHNFVWVWRLGGGPIDEFHHDLWSGSFFAANSDAPRRFFDQNSTVPGGSLSLCLKIAPRNFLVCRKNRGLLGVIQLDDKTRKRKGLRSKRHEIGGLMQKLPAHVGIHAREPNFFDFLL